MTLACWLYNMDAAPNTDYWGGGEAIFCSEYRVCAILTKHSSLLCGGWPETMLITSSHSHGNTVSVQWQCTKVLVLSVILYNCSWQYLSCTLSRILLSMCYEPQEKILIRQSMVPPSHALTWSCRRRSETWGSSRCRSWPCCSRWGTRGSCQLTLGGLSSVNLGCLQ